MMADYIGYAHSNFFAVVDEAAFDLFCAKWGLSKIGNAATGVGFNPDDAVWEDHSLPAAPRASWRAAHEETDEDGYIADDYDGPDLLDDLAPLLADDSVAVVMDVGHEKVVYVGGSATAINNRGERESISLEDIFDRAARLGGRVTRAAG